MMKKCIRMKKCIMMKKNYMLMMMHIMMNTCMMMMRSIHDDDEKHDDTDEEMNDVENADELKDDQVIDDAEKVDSKKTEEKKVDIEQVGDDKVEDDQVGSLISMTHNEKPEVPTSSFKLSLSFNYGNKLLNLSSDTSLVGTAKELIDIEINNIAAESLSELELKKILFDKMDKSQSYMSHDKHHDLYDALLNSIMLDEAIASGDVNPDKVLRKRDRCDDQNPNVGSDEGKQKRRKGKDFDPSEDKVRTGSSLKGKTQLNPSSTGKLVNAEEPLPEAEMDVAELILDDVVNEADQPQDKAAPTQGNPSWFKQPPRPPTPDPEWNKDKVIDKLTKADLVGPVYKLLKGTCKSIIELEYNIERCYLALSDQLDWKNPEGDICPYDLSKPLPLQASPGHLTILADFFLNNDLEYLKTGDKEKKYIASITKTKVTRYELEELTT
ncbi:hypothetical protein Tco_0580264 [Tanacetum coccineum]